MNVTPELIRRIAEKKFPGDPKKAEEYIRNFNPSDPACIDDEKQFAKAQADTGSQLDEARQRFRVEDYFIRKLIYDFYTGEIHAYLFVGADRETQKKKAEELSKGDPQEQKMAEWIMGGFTDKPLTLDQEKPQKYRQAMKKFSEKYGVHLDAENVASAIREIAHDKEGQKENYRQYFKCMFASAYCRLDEEKQAHIDDLCGDFNKIMMLTLEENTGVDDVPAMRGKDFVFGGMQKEEIGEYLLSFRETANDLTKQAETEQKSGNKPFKEVVTSVKEILSGDGSREEKMALGMAQLQALELRRAAHPKHFRFTSPIENYREKKAISEIRKMMVAFSGSKNEVEEMERRKTIYRPSFVKEKEKIGVFCEKTVREFDLDDFLSQDVVDLGIFSDREESIGEEILSSDKEPVFTDNSLFEDTPASRSFIPEPTGGPFAEKGADEKEKNALQEELYGSSAPVLQAPKRPTDQH